MNFAETLTSDVVHVTKWVVDQHGKFISYAAQLPDNRSAGAVDAENGTYVVACDEVVTVNLFLQAIDMTGFGSS